MPAVFLSGRWAAPEILRLLAGGSLPEGREARLPGHAVRPGLAGIGTLAPAPGAWAEGVLCALDAEALARCDFAMAAFGAFPCPVEVACADGPRGALAHLGGDARAAGPDEGPGHAAEIVSEILSQWGRRGADALPGLMRGISSRALARARGPETRAPCAVRQSRRAEEVEGVSLDRPYSAFFGMEEHRLRHRRFDGAMSPVLERAVFASGDAVTLLPYDPRHDRVLILEQFRPGPFARRDPVPWCLEAIAGRCEPGEPPEETARREAVEEAGLAIGRLARITGFYPTPGIASEFITAFVGEADLEGAGGFFGLAEEAEDIRAVVLPFEAAFGLVATGEANNGPLLVSLLWLHAHRAGLRGAWGGALDAREASR